MLHWENKAQADSDDDDDTEVCKVIGNEMFYTGDIRPENNLEFVEKFKRLESNLLKWSAELTGYTPEIRIYINSDGGDLHCGFQLMNILEKSRVKVTTIAQGTCASAATFFLLGGSDRRISKNATILIHQLSSGLNWGKYTELRDEVKMCDKHMRLVRATYEEKTSIPESKLQRFLTRDSYITPVKAIKYRVCHAYE